MNPTPVPRPTPHCVRTVDEIRGQFPALASDWAFFDHAGGSPPARFAIDRMARYMSETPFQHGASYPLSQQAVAGFVEGRAAAARLLNAAPDEVALGPSSTTLVARLARAIAPSLAPGDEIVVTNLDHETNITPWRRLEEQGVRIREWKFREEDQALHPEDLDELLSDRTRLVACTHCSNLIGTIHDVPEIARRVHAAGAKLCVDGVAFAPHRRIDVRALDVDFYFFSTYKTFGPHAAALFVRADHLPDLTTQGFFFQPTGSPKVLEPGSVPHELAAGLTGVTEYLAWLAGDGPGGTQISDATLDIAWGCIEARERELVRPLLTLLEDHPRVELYGLANPDDARRVSTVSFTVEGRQSSELPAALDERKLAARFGHFYAHRAVEALGLHERDGVVRVSLLHINDQREIERLVTALGEIL
ncbi:MAG: cysteine desulfurase family protein (TIGR01976 family) [Chlamydiales bacterium]|jgi:cysteine desulfurase family protein (TIGR01976 family)